MINYLLS